MGTVKLGKRRIAILWLLLGVCQVGQAAVSPNNSNVSSSAIVNLGTGSDTDSQSQNQTNQINFLVADSLARVDLGVDSYEIRSFADAQWTDSANGLASFASTVTIGINSGPLAFSARLGSAIWNYTFTTDAAGSITLTGTPTIGDDFRTLVTFDGVGVNFLTIANPTHTQEFEAGTHTIVVERDAVGMGGTITPAQNGSTTFAHNIAWSIVETGATECSDGIDNDLDGLIDFPSDPGCDSPIDDDETDPPVFQCSDGIDNDNDGLIDFPEDPGCEGPIDNTELSILSQNPSFNVDIERSDSSSFGLPSDTFSAAGIPGVWTRLDVLSSGPQPLLDITGSQTGVTVTNSQQLQAGGRFLDNASTFGDDQALLDDGWNMSPGVGVQVAFTVEGLAAGSYSIFTYAWDPSFTANRSSEVDVNGVGSVLIAPSSSVFPGYEVGQTHSVHAVTIAAGEPLVITVTNADDVFDQNSVNGFQIQSTTEVLEGNFIDFNTRADGTPFDGESTLIPNNEYQPLGVVIADSWDPPEPATLIARKMSPVVNESLVSGHALLVIAAALVDPSFVEVSFDNGTREVAFDFVTPSGQVRVLAFDEFDAVIADSIFTGTDRFVQSFVPGFEANLLAGHAVMNVGQTMFKIRVEEASPGIEALIFDNLRFELPIPDSAVIADDVVLGSGVVIGENVKVAKKTQIDVRVTIGNDSEIEKNVVIGNDSTIGVNVSIAKGVQIGANVQIGDGTIVEKSVVIGDNVAIGNNVIIRKQATVLDGAVVLDGTEILKEATFP